MVLTGTPKGVGAVKGGDVITAGVRVGGVEVEEGRVQVEVRDREGGRDWGKAEGEDGEEEERGGKGKGGKEEEGRNVPMDLMTWLLVWTLLYLF